MARPLRIEFPGALYHVTSRGNARAPVFLGDDDRTGFLKRLHETVERYHWLCHAYCLMDNHYHLLIETPEPNLSLGMRQLNGVYTQSFNRQHGRVGHLFQGRYKAILVDKDSYFLELARYIVLNPVRAGMVDDASEYPWSSYLATAGKQFAPAWLSYQAIHAQLAGSTSLAQQRYRDFVYQGQGAVSPWTMLKGQALLGSDQFVRRMQPLLDEAARQHEVPRYQRLAHRPELATLFPADNPLNKIERDERIRLAGDNYGYTMAEIARAVGLHYSTISKVLKGSR
ncbi:MAG: transposase [Chromatiales bacterium]|nr:transposase [Chromatiales bacterium]